MAEFHKEFINDLEAYNAISRNRLLAAISAAEIRGFEATKEALVELLREMEQLRSHQPEAFDLPQGLCRRIS
jgi:hypothetical protein